MRALITGHRGFVGHATQTLFEERGIEVIGYDLLDGYDIRNIDMLCKVVENTHPTHILHLAAIARFAEADADPLTAFETNVQGTKNVADVAATYGLPIVYASTGSVYMPIEQDPPITEEFPARGNSVYACSKYLGELYVNQLPKHITLRYAHLYGKEKVGHGLISGFLERIKRGLTPKLYGGAQSNDFCYIADVAKANYLALTADAPAWNQVYNIGTGEELTAEKAGRIICQVVGYDGAVEVMKGRTVDPLRFVYDVSKAARMLGFKAQFSFRHGLKEMLADGAFSDQERRQDVATGAFERIA